jgi:NAD dependent epimerase/dehydratase family enzyme
LDAPGAVLKLGLGKMAQEMLLEGQRVLPKNAQAAGFEWRFEQLETALRDLLAR